MEKMQNFNKPKSVYTFRTSNCNATNAQDIGGGQVNCSLLHLDSNVADTGINVVKNADTTVMIKGNSNKTCKIY